MFNFYAPYKVTSSTGSQFIAIGITFTKDESTLLYLVPGAGIRSTVGIVVSDSGDAVEVADSVASEDSGKPVSLVFEPLTLEGLKEMGPDNVVGLDSLLEKLHSDEDVGLFFRSEYLDPTWVNQYESGVPLER